MNKFLSVFILFLTSFSLFAGNPDRVGQAGATELTINPWARSSGWVGSNTAGISGVEAMMFNPAGIVGVPNSEFLFSRTAWLSGSDIFINSFGLTQKMGAAKNSAIGISIMSFDFGRIEITTENQPEGGIGTYSPSFVNIGLSYSYIFSDRIRAGLTTRIISESIPNARAMGVCFDAGLQYITDLVDEEKQRTKFGVSLRNVGTPMKFGGDGLTRRGSFEGEEVTLSVDTRSAGFELPTLVNIGASQDFYLDPSEYHRLTFSANFTSNSFSNDQFNFGLEYSLKNIVMLRGGYLYEKGITKRETRKNVFNGPAAGFSVNLPFGKEKDKMFAVDYSYRFTDYFGGTHSFGARIVL
ncbi:MAG TPA: PorV/PorQ family protein [Bacteroidia bacterium]|nr:PorV/PorQ family protein [Sphingobacteriales bacterium]HPD64740.1 PorV/PorQ family protein [Bacteroidia bacterium]HRS59320.1 PorV/PorQ family protein [Bacteroidia bacterium]